MGHSPVMRASPVRGALLGVVLEDVSQLKKSLFYFSLATARATWNDY
jgi:hypothetical protein